MTDKAIAEILARWDQIIAKIGELSPKAYEICLRQAYWVSGVRNLIVAGMLLIILFVVCIWCICRAATQEWGTDDGYIGGAMFSGVAVIVLVLIVNDCIAYIMNPHYYAIKGLLALLLQK